MSSAKKTGIFLLSLAVLAGLAGTAACQKKADEGAGAEVRKAVTEFDGTVKAALGRYMYLSTAQGFDIVLPSFDAASILGKDVVVKGNLLVAAPMILALVVAASGLYAAFKVSEEGFRLRFSRSAIAGWVEKLSLQQTAGRGVSASSLSQVTARARLSAAR